jgi:hypothetical protein
MFASPRKRTWGWARQAEGDLRRAAGGRRACPTLWRRIKEAAVKGGDISHAVALARGEVPLKDLQAALAKAALAKGWRERR